MTLSEHMTLAYFGNKSRRIDGKTIDWSQAHLPTFRILEDLKTKLKKEIEIVREIHPGKPTAVDFVVPGCHIERVFLELDPRPAAVGYYAGTYGPSYHIDLRPIEGNNRAARWMAVRPKDEERIKEFSEFITSRTAEWIYLAWSVPRGFRALVRVFEIAEDHRRATEGAHYA